MMNDSSQEIKSLAWGVRGVTLVLTLILSYFNVHLALHISSFQTVFSDMLGGKPLPLLTVFILRSTPFWIGSSILFVIAALLVILLIRSHMWALLSSAGIMAAIFLQIVITWTGLFAPLFSIVNALSSGS